MLVTGILIVVSSSIFVLINRSQERYVTERQYSEAVENARVALDTIVRYIRQAGNDPLDLVAQDPIQPTGDGMFIYSDLTGAVPSTTGNAREKTGDPDGQLDAVFEVIRIQYVSGQKAIVYDAGYGPQILAEDIQNLRFTYYDRNGTITANPPDIHKVRVELEALSQGKDLASQKQSSVTLFSDVYIRSKQFSPYAGGQ